MKNLESVAFAEKFGRRNYMKHFWRHYLEILEKYA